MEYFGTNLREAGHYRWSLDGEYMVYSPKGMLNFNDLPFHPENLTNNLNKGDVVFYQGGGFTCLAISGSCRDDRPGTKSVFWVRDTISKGDMVNRILSNSNANKLIAQMKFEVKWNV